LVRHRLISRKRIALVYNLKKIRVRVSICFGYDAVKFRSKNRILCSLKLCDSTFSPKLSAHLSLQHWWNVSDRRTPKYWGQNRSQRHAVYHTHTALTGLKSEKGSPRQEAGDGHPQPCHNHIQPAVHIKCNNTVPTAQRMGPG